MPQIDLAALAKARREALTLAEKGLSATDASAQLKRNKVPDAIADAAVQAAGAELHSEVNANVRRGLAYAVAEVGVALITSQMFAASDALPEQVSTIVFLIALQGVTIVARAWFTRMRMTGWPSTDPLPALGVNVDDLRSDQELLARDAARHKRSKRASRMALIIAAIFAVALAGLISGSLGKLALIFGIAVVFVPLKHVFSLFEGLDPPPWSEAFNFKPKTSELPAVYQIAKLAASPDIPLEEVPRAGRLRTWQSRSGEVPGERTKKEQKFVSGVLYGTILGISFLPDLESELIETLMVVGQPAAQVVGDVLNVKPISELLQIGGETAGERSSHEAWLTKSIGNKWHYAIPWPELVRVEYQPRLRYVVMTRHGADNAATHFFFRHVERAFAGRLMSARLLYERNMVVYSVLIAPKIAELRKAVRDDLIKAYGDRVDEYAADIEREANRRLDAWFVAEKPDVTSLIRSALGEHIERYRDIPEVRVDHSDLFATAVVPAVDATPR